MIIYSVLDRIEVKALIMDNLDDSAVLSVDGLSRLNKYGYPH